MDGRARMRWEPGGHKRGHRNPPPVPLACQRGDKSAPRVRHADARHRLTFREQYGDAVQGALLLHTGDDVFWAADRVLAAPSASG
jgi:hypothetical protein